MGQMLQPVVRAPYSPKPPCLRVLRTEDGAGHPLASPRDPCAKWRLSLLGGMIEPLEEVRMRRLIVVAAGLMLAFAVTARAADTAAGKAVFEGAKPACKSCHTEARNPLTKVGATYTPEELKAWIRTPKEMMAKKGKKGLMPAFPEQKMSNADLDALVAYLATMK